MVGRTVTRFRLPASDLVTHGSAPNADMPFFPSLPARGVALLATRKYLRVSLELLTHFRMAPQTGRQTRMAPHVRRIVYELEIPGQFRHLLRMAVEITVEPLGVRIMFAYIVLRTPDTPVAVCTITRRPIPAASKTAGTAG
jgi:hypothetical protein